MPTHSEHRHMPYTADQLYRLVADVEKYPEFLPWTAACRIRERRQVGEACVMDVDMVISFKVYRERFGSRVTLREAEREIDVQYLDGPFKYLTNEWRFADLPEGGCEARFHVDFEFRNRILGSVIGVVFNEAMQRVVRAFERRAAALYGAPSRAQPAAEA